MENAIKKSSHFPNFQKVGTFWDVLGRFGTLWDIVDHNMLCYVNFGGLGIDTLTSISELLSFFEKNIVTP